MHSSTSHRQNRLLQHPFEHSFDFFHCFILFGCRCCIMKRIRAFRRAFYESVSPNCALRKSFYLHTAWKSIFKSYADTLFGGRGAQNMIHCFPGYFFYLSLISGHRKETEANLKAPLGVISSMRCKWETFWLFLFLFLFLHAFLKTAS